jgi:hypothetical protein
MAMHFGAKTPMYDGLGGLRFAVKGGVIISFLVLITTFNYLSTGQVPSLWTAGDDFVASTDHAMSFLQRNLKDDDEDVRTAFGSMLFP